MYNVFDSEQEVPVRNALDSDRQTIYLCKSPTGAQRINYESTRFNKSGKNKGFESRQKFAEKLIIGIKPGGLHIPAALHDGVLNKKINLEPTEETDKAKLAQYIHDGWVSNDKKLITFCGETDHPFFVEKWKTYALMPHHLTDVVMIRMFDGSADYGDDPEKNE